MYSIGSTTLLGDVKNTDGYWVRVYAPTSGMTLDTTASTYAVGCEIVNTADGIRYYNVGTVAAPVWESGSLSRSKSLTAAQINALYTVPIEVVPAVAGKAIIVDDIELDLVGTATQFAGGGVVGVQYKGTTAGLGTLVHADITAAQVTGATGRVISQRIGKDQSVIATADIVGQSLYISNKTAAFGTGTGTATVRVRYHLI